MNKSLDDIGTTTPSPKDALLAGKSGRILSEYLGKTKKLTLQLVNSKNQTKKIELPSKALQLLVAILEHMEQGNTVCLIPLHVELTTQNAADLLNVSRPFVVNLLKEGKIPFYKVGTKRRILAEDVLQYKADLNKKRLKTLEALTKQAQALDMGY